MLYMIFMEKLCYGYNKADFGFSQDKTEKNCTSEEKRNMSPFGRNNEKCLEFSLIKILSISILLSIQTVQ